jgi:hypothetical protein
MRVRRVLLIFAVVAVACSSIQVSAQSVILPQLGADNFNNRAIPSIRGGYADLDVATAEVNEPLIPGLSAGRTVWWNWNAPANGILTLTISATGFVPLLTVYTGNDLPNLSLVASNNYLACYESSICGCHWRERNGITLHVVQGQAYQICADAAIYTDTSMQLLSTPITIGTNVVYLSTWRPVFTTNVLSGQFNLQWQFTAAPINDDFENRTSLFGERTRIVVSNAGASKEANEPNHSGNVGGSSVWYSWTAPASGRVTVSANKIPPYLPPSWTDIGVGVIDLYPIGPPTCGNEIDQNPPPPFYPVFAAYTGANLNSLALARNCQPMNLDAYPHAIQFDAIGGKAYQIAFDGNMGTTDTIPLYLALTTPASNDNFQNRIQLHGINVAATGFNAGATHESGEPLISGATGKSVWWSWTAPVSGMVTIDASGSDYSFPVGVFVGTSGSDLNLIADAAGGVSFDAVQGKTYQICVEDADGMTGGIKFKLQAPVVQLPLTKMIVRRRFGVVSFSASPHQIVLLQSSNDGSTWHNDRTTMAREAKVNFIVSPPPAQNGPFYRAIVVDYQ